MYKNALYNWDGTTATLMSEEVLNRSNVFYRKSMWTLDNNFFTTSDNHSLKRYDKDFNLITDLSTPYTNTVCVTNMRTGSAIIYKDSYSNINSYFVPDINNYNANDLIFLIKRIKYADSWYGMYKHKVDINFTDNSEETDFKASVFDLKDNLLARSTLAPGTTSATIEVPTPDPVKVIISGIPEDVHQTDHDYEVNDIITVNDTNRSYICTTAGTTAVTKPAYPDTSGATITDGTAVFTERGKLAQPVVIYPLNPTLI